MTAPPKISFIVPLYNHLAETREMLASLQASLPGGLDYEIILADDASTDDTRAWLQGLTDARLRVHLNERNLGYAATNNAGVRLARGELLGLLNNDLLFQPGWLAPMLEVLLAPVLKAGLVGNVHFRVADGVLDHAGISLSPEGRLHHTRTLSHQPYVKTLAVTGACMLLCKADFMVVGGFDEVFVNGGEDIDLCYKIKAAGKAIYLASESRIRHHVSLTRKTNTLQDLRNSRHLFGRWRKEIKRELSEVWHSLLTAGSQAYADKISGELATEFVGTPQVAAMVIAEAMLRREETLWVRELGEANTAWTGKVSAWGLRHSIEHGGHVLVNSAMLVVEGVDFLRNLLLCGRRIGDLSSVATLTFDVNGLQRLSVTLKPERILKVGINDPLLLPGLANHFQVTLSGAMVVTHLVVDDRVVHL